MEYVYQPTGEPGNHMVDPENMGQGYFNPAAGDLWPFGPLDPMNQFRAPMPPGFNNHFELNEYDPEYLEALRQVKELGIRRGGTAGDPIPLDDPGFHIGNFWSYNGSPCTGTPPRLYNIIARQIATAKGNSLRDNALLFTMINVGLANAGITAWDSKYHYAMWRPILGIRQHPDATVRNATWSPLGASRSNPVDSAEHNFSPPFPAYTSGHATFGAVALKVLANFYQTNDIAFTFVSDEWNSFTKDEHGRVRPFWPRTFDSLLLANAENAASRVFNGVHWRFDGTEGVRAGCDIADFIFTNMFVPLNNPKKKRSVVPHGDFEGAINCILENPDYQDTGACHEY